MSKEDIWLGSALTAFALVFLLLEAFCTWDSSNKQEDRYERLVKLEEKVKALENVRY